MTASLSVAAERCILGAMMHSREGADTATRHLAAADFHDHRNGRIYDELLEMWGNGEPTGPIALLDRLSERGALTRSDTGPLLTTIYGEACSVQEIGHYARIVLNEADRRDVLFASAALAQAATLDDSNARREKTAAIMSEAMARQANTSAGSGNRVVLTKASTFTMRGARWLYKGRIPAGMLTLLAGREGIGKSTVALDIAARVTRGTLSGRYEGKPQAVMVVATEDSWEYTIRPRLQAVSANLDLVYHVAVREDGKERGIIVGVDTAIMEKAFQAVRPALLIVDPLMSVLGGSVDTHRQAEVQAALEPLVALCDRIDMAVLALIHVNKGKGSDALNSIMGSRAFTSLPRSVLYCIEEDDGQLMFAHAKCNIGPKMPTMGYSIAPVVFELDPATVEPGDDTHTVTSRVVWGREDSRSADEILSDKGQDALGANLGGARRDVMELADAAGGAITKKRLADDLFGEHDAKAIDNALTRLVKAGDLVKVGYGVYQSAKYSPGSTHPLGEMSSEKSE